MLIDLHSHTTFSDGTLTFDDMVAAAERRGYDAYAITDHARGASGDHRHVAEHVRENIERLAHETPMRLFAGVELTDYSPERIDRVALEARRAGAQVIVVHGECVSLDVAPGTNAAAARSRQVDILAHPGLLEEEDAFEAMRHDVYVEISARLGACWANGHIYQVVRKTGAKVVVDSDAHDEAGLLSAPKVAALVHGAGGSEVYLARVRDQMATEMLWKLHDRVAVV
ncbi:MAG: histidinol phosphate phosphatase domain-containing protein [Chloroflexota bacterium]